MTWWRHTGLEFLSSAATKVSTSNGVLWTPLSRPRTASSDQLAACLDSQSASSTGQPPSDSMAARNGLSPTSYTAPVRHGHPPRGEALFYDTSRALRCFDTCVTFMPTKFVGMQIHSLTHCCAWPASHRGLHTDCDLTAHELTACPRSTSTCWSHVRRRRPAWQASPVWCMEDAKRQDKTTCVVFVVENVYF